MTLRARLLAAFAYLLLLAVVALAVPLGVNVDHRARDGFYQRIDAQAQVIAASLGGAPLPGKTLTGVRTAVARYAGEVDGRVVVTDRRGRLIADSAHPNAARIVFATPGRPEIAEALVGQGTRFVRRSSDLGQSILVVAYPVLDGGRVVGAVRVSQPITAVNASVRRSWIAIAAVAVGVLVMGLVVAWLLATSLVRPLRGLRTSAARLGEGHLDERAGEDGPPDIADVARALNATADNLVGMIERQREFVGNASHQLRTPLTGLRLRLEGIAAESAPNPEADAALVEVDRMADLVSDLLALARAGVPPETAATSDLAEQARAAAERWRQVAAEHDQTFQLEDPGAAIPIGADAADVAAVLDNLIENAIVYSPAGATIRVASSSNGAGLVRVQDDGPGIDPAEATRVFDRFYRGSSGRQTPGGTGLGLAIARDLAGRWGGSIQLEQPERGTRIAVRFPTATAITDPEPVPNQTRR